MNTVSIRNINSNFPSSWSELNRRNIVFLAKHYPAFILAPTYGFAYHFFMHLLDLWRRPRLSFQMARAILLSKKLDRDWKNDFYMEFGETHYFEQQILIAISQLDHFNWIREMQPTEKCLFPFFRIGFTKYYGPGDLLANVTAEEFYNADDFLMLFLTQKESKYLEYMMAVLWREKADKPTSADIRKPFNEFEVEKRAAKFRKLKPYIKYACLLAYMGLREYFIHRPASEFVFSGEMKAEQKSKETNFGTILMRLAESHVFGVYAETKKTSIHDVIDHLADLKQRNEELKLKNQND